MKRLNRKGAGLPGLMLALPILVTVILAGLIFNVPLRRNINWIEKRQMAFTLAQAQMEDLRFKALTDFSGADLTAGTGKATTLTDVPTGFTITYDVSDHDWTEDSVVDTDYKLIKIKCQYTQTTVFQKDSTPHDFMLYGYVVAI